MDQLADELWFGAVTAAPFEIATGVFQQQCTTQRVLYFGDMRTGAQQGGVVVAQRQQVVEEAPAVRGPGQVFREARHRIAGEQALQACKVDRIGP